MKCYENLKKYMNMFDMYGHRIDVYIDSRQKVKSKFGAFISISIFALCFFIFATNFLKWYNIENLKTIPSTKSFTVQELLSKNQSYEYDLDFSNFYFYTKIFLNLENGTKINDDDIPRYLDLEYILIDENKVYHKLDSEYCSNEKKIQFLLGEIENLQNLFENNGTFCFASKLKMGLIPNLKEQVIESPSLLLKIKMCNASNEKNQCESQQNIGKALKNSIVQLSFPKTIYDFKNTKNPRKRIYDFKSFLLNENMTKYNLAKLSPFYLYTDHGILEDHNHLDSIDFNLESLTSEMSLIDQDFNLFSLSIIFGMNQQIYYRQNDKLYDLFANFGGIINILFIAGKFICSSYNRLVLKHKLINIMFSNLGNDQKPPASPSSHSNNEFGFSLFSLIFPSLSNNKGYSKALKNLYEYMDLKNIIKRLQDIDKLKMLLLDENQRRIFEILPKPGIAGKIKQKSSIWTIEKIHESKNFIKNKDFTKNNLKFLLNGDMLNKRMLNMLDPKTKEEFISPKLGFFMFRKDF